ncbi:hypothetical protein THF1C08_20343 [Vibrio jasicida]|uniref:Uncharacterized protein n=1 Tax=Vibrio jasicida TaxID=766224 RepID=A0AAU9QMX6_9VIBR|nr:hypothetical protein THF1C08_20343 [Vibrio jasicida]CAH1586991.1 hypothetical protein THF1A12_20345 [Vibrio jasicida]
MLSLTGDGDDCYAFLYGFFALSGQMKTKVEEGENRIGLNESVYLCASARI